MANEKNKKRKKSSVADPEEESSVSLSEDRTSSSFARDDLDGDEDDQSAGDTEDGAGPEQHESGLTLNSLLGRFTKIRSSNNRTPRKPGNFRPSVLKEVGFVWHCLIVFVKCHFQKAIVYCFLNQNRHA